MQPTILKRSQVRLAEVAASEPPAPFASAARCVGPKKAVLVEHAGRARALEFTCSCGETTLIELVFPEEKEKSA